MNEETKKTILDLAEKVDVLQPFQIKAELIRILQLNSNEQNLMDEINGGSR